MTIDAEPLAQRLHLLGGVEQDRVEVGQGAGLIREKLDPEVLRDAGAQRVGPGEHEVDVETARGLLGGDLAGQLRRGRLVEGQRRNKLRIGGGVGLDSRLRQRQVARRRR